jgi:alpha-L-fucosidase 2
MGGSVEFYLDFLIEDSRRQLGKTPSLSPENSFILRDGTKGVLCEEPTIDNQIFYSLFTAFDKAAKILGKDDKDDKVAV